MKRRTFQEQMRTVVSAYTEGRLNPYCANHCFIAYLMGHKLWKTCDELHNIDGNATALDISSSDSISDLKLKVYTESQGLYELADIIALERKFLEVMQQHLDRSAPLEEAMYEALCVTLHLLKTFHEAEGETCYYEPVPKADYKAVHEGGLS
jgi:hypothetical protein